MATTMKIGELALATEVSRDTLRFYEQRGLIRAARRDNGYRHYAPETVQLVGYIRLAQRLGFSLAEIGENLPALWDAPAPEAALAQLLSDKVVAIDARIAELHALRAGLTAQMDTLCPLAPRACVA